MSFTTLYNSEGRAVAYIDEDGESIYLYDGTPVAWLRDDAIYDYGGDYLGWYQDGWFFDRTGTRAFYTEEATGGPARPARRAPPARGARLARPARSACRA